MPKMSIDFEGFGDVLTKLEKLNQDTKKIAEEALKKTHEIVTEKAEKAMVKPNLPHGGKYSNDQTISTLRRNADIEWSGDIGTVHVGFDIAHGGLASIFLMYGTPKMKPAHGLESAFYGSATRKEITKAQEDIFYSALARVME